MFRSSTRRDSNLSFLLILASLVVSTTACSDKGSAPKASQVIAKVNDKELSIHQLNSALQEVPAQVPADQLTKIRKAALDRLVEQEVLVQASIEKKRDREPAVVQQLEAARRDILARAYLQSVSETSAKANEAAIKQFYTENPALFKDRNVFQFTEINLPRVPSNWAELEKSLKPANTVPEVVEVLRKYNINLPVSQNIVRGVEDLPIESAKAISAMKDGEIVIYSRPPGLVIALIQARKADSIDEKAARPKIEQFLNNKAKADAVTAEVKRLKDGAKVTYLGDFSETAEKKEPSPVKQSPAANKSDDQNAMDKGVKGLK
jgi:EpsD family peptidyl-prolyl cis-trans isomerase